MGDGNEFRPVSDQSCVPARSAQHSASLPHSRIVAVRLPLLIACGLAACAAPAPTPSAAEPPDGLLGTFVDDYGATYEITDSTWRHAASTYRVQAWDVAGQRLLLAGPGETQARVWMRIDWVDLPATTSGPTEGDWTWGWCVAAWEAESRAAALAAPESRRDAPRTGCGDSFPFTRMRRVEGAPAAPIG